MLIIHPSTIQLLRLKFSFFLMPVFWFALSCISNIHWGKAILIGVILHVIIYPSSNGYNSYMDRDTDSVGGIKNPLQPTKQLFYVSIVLDVLAIVLSLFISEAFVALILLYIVCSRLYSYRKVRIKQYAILGYLTVIINQGAVVFLAVYWGASTNVVTEIPWLLLVVASCLIGGFYPITQVYQHKQDKADNVKTISMLLGIKVTFIFCALAYTLAFALLYFYYSSNNQLVYFFVLQVLFLPIIFYFIKWFLKVLKDDREANFENTMFMNVWASSFTNLAFIILLLIK